MQSQVILKSNKGFDLVPLESKLIMDRKIFIEGEITSKIACDFARKVMLLISDNRRTPIDVMINSVGGEINAGLLIYDILQTSKTAFRTFCLGQAYSMAAVLLSSGTEGMRFMLRNAELMIHEPLISSHIAGNSSSIESISESLLETKSKINSILARHTGRTKHEIDKATSYNHFFNAEESVKFGLADAVVDFDKIFEIMD